MPKKSPKLTPSAGRLPVKPSGLANDFDSPLGILHSPFAQEILAQMSHEERRRLVDEVNALAAVRLRYLRGVSLILITFLLTSMFFKASFLPWLVFGTIMASIVIFLFWQQRHFRRVRESVADILCSTTYAKSRRFQREQLL